jgi:hypothetical protein
MYEEEEFEYIKVVNCQRIAQVKKQKINDLQITTQKTKDRATRTPLITGCELGYFAMVAVPSPLLVIFSGHFGFLHE